MTIICAQTFHKLTAKEVASWLEKSMYCPTILGIQVYGYFLEDRYGIANKEGYWWVAKLGSDKSLLEIELDKRRNNTLFPGGVVRVYREKKYFNVQLLEDWPDAVRFRVSWDRHSHSSSPLLHSTYGHVVKFPYSYNDMCVARRKKEEKAKENENLEMMIEEPKDRKMELMAEILSKMEELKKLL